eukprot:7595469-Alexandrium_andersonii.AAC.1
MEVHQARRAQTCMRSSAGVVICSSRNASGRSCVDQLLHWCTGVLVLTAHARMSACACLCACVRACVLACMHGCLGVSCGWAGARGSAL